MINLFRKMFQRKSPKSSVNGKVEVKSGTTSKTSIPKTSVVAIDKQSDGSKQTQIDIKPRISIDQTIRTSHSTTLRESVSDWDDADLITLKEPSGSSFNTNTPSEIEMSDSEGSSRRLEKERRTQQHYRARRIERIAARISAEEHAFKESKEVRMRLIERHREKFEFEVKSKVSSSTQIRRTSTSGTSREDLSDGIKKKTEAIEKKNLIILQNLIAKKPQMFIGDLQVLSDISSGKFSRVLYAVREKDGEMNEHVVKIREKNVRMWRVFKLELRILEKSSFTDHPFVVQVFNFLQTKGHLCLVMEFLHGGTLKAHLTYEKRFAEWRALFYSSCILQALDFLHDQDIVHKGITSENIMLDKAGYAKLSGFGSSQILSRKLPEYDKLGVSHFEHKLLDLRQLAHLLHFMISGKHLETFPHPKINKRLSSLAQDAIHNIFSLKPQNFASAADVSSFPFFKQINWSKLYKKAIKPPEYRRLTIVENSPEKTFETVRSSVLIRNAPYERYFDKGNVWKMN